MSTTCFDILRAAGRRADRLESIADVPWLQPCPDSLLDEAGPEGSAIRRETVELVAAVTSALQRDRSVFGDWRLLPTAANRMPAAASYLRRAGGDRFLPFKLDVLRTGAGQITEITTFGTTLFDRFGLPASLPAD